MTRQELYKAMEHEKIILYHEFLAHLERTPLAELVARWAGVLELAKAHDVQKRRADWLVMSMWSSTALTVGEDELVRRANKRKRDTSRRIEAELKCREEKIQAILSGKKLAFWRLCSAKDRKTLVENFLPGCDEFYQKYVREHYLADLGGMTDRVVLLWFWNALPPFSIEYGQVDTPESKAA